MSRAENRHHEDRTKAKWRRRERRRPNVSGPLSAWKAQPPAREVERHAVRRAHHNKCDCSMCKKSDHHERTPKPAERRGVLFGETGGSGR